MWIVERNSNIPKALESEPSGPRKGVNFDAKTSIDSLFVSECIIAFFFMEANFAV